MVCYQNVSNMYRLIMIFDSANVVGNNVTKQDLSIHLYVSVAPVRSAVIQTSLARIMTLCESETSRYSKRCVHELMAILSSILNTL